MRKRKCIILKRLQEYTYTHGINLIEEKRVDFIYSKNIKNKI